MFFDISLSIELLIFQKKTQNNNLNLDKFKFALIQIKLLFIKDEKYKEMNFIKKISNISPSNKQSPLIQIPFQEQQMQQAQVALIKALKDEILRVQQQALISKQQTGLLRKQLSQSRLQIQSLNQKLKTLTQNNQSLLHTLQVFQREFVKRNKRQVQSPSKGTAITQTSGPFHLEIVRSVRSTIVNNMIQPVKMEEISEFKKLYTYFFQQNYVEQEEVQMYNNLVQGQKKIRPSKVKSLGKRNFFNQRFRHIFWFNAIENRLKLTNKYYSLIENQRQQNIENRPPRTSIIDLDIRRMDFRIQQQKTGKLKFELKKLLQLFELYRPDIGYVQGMSYFGWMFLIRLSPLQSFITFSNIILCDPFISCLYTFNQVKIKRIVQFFEVCLKDKKPKLFKYFQQLGVDSELFIIQWAYTFFSRAFSIRIVSKIWDLWFSQGFNVFYKVAMTIFQMLEDQLMRADQNDKFVQLLRNNTFKLQQNQFLRLLSKQKLFQDLKLQLI